MRIRIGFAKQLVHKPNACDQLRWLQCSTNHPEDNVIPTLIYLPTTYLLWLELNLKMATICIFLDLPIRVLYHP